MGRTCPTTSRRTAAALLMCACALVASLSACSSGGANRDGGSGGGTGGPANTGGAAGPGGGNGAAGRGGSASGGTTGGAGGRASSSGGSPGSGGARASGGQRGSAGATGGGGSAGGGGAPTAMGGRGGVATGEGGRLATGGAPEGGSPGNVAWTTRTLMTGQVAEGAEAADINGDGTLDLVAGPVWFDGAKDFALGGQVVPTLPMLSMTEYSKFFLTFIDDLNGDGRPDVILIGDAGGANGTGNPNALWYENPGPAGLADNAWTKHPLVAGLVGNESPAYVNLVGDAKRELVFISCLTGMTSGSCPGGQLAYARPGATPNAAWSITFVGGDFSSAWVHGLGVGDVDKDGLNDVVERTGWWRQVDATTWERHAFDFWSGSTSERSSNWGGAQMYVADVDGDGDNDVVTVLAAHQYGLAWFEHQGPAVASGFLAHDILPTTAGKDNLSQMHAMAMADVNGDGLPDLITGKRYYAHDDDPGVSDPPYLTWFELQRSGATATYVRHDIHDASGVGCNFIARDLNGDGKVDVFTSNKRGTFLHLQR